MLLATWNVNSLKVRLPHVIDWLAANQPDFLCLQELKLDTPEFPHAEIEAAGYQALVNGQKTYNGVAILARKDQVACDVVTALPGFEDPQRRVLAATFGDLRVVSLYVPNGQSLDSDKYAYKLNWLTAANCWLKAELSRYPRMAVLGDFNIAPDDRDVHDPAAWSGQVLVSPAERTAFCDWIGLGFHDAFRLFEQAPKLYSWWDYRQLGFQKNQGLRIDHILLSAALAQHCKSCRIDKAPRKLQRPSDHAPVIAELAL